MTRRSLTVLACCVGLGVLVGAGRPKYPLRDAVECTVRGGLPNVLAKLEAGKHVCIAYLGGSITNQAGWRVLTREWFAKQYPKATVTEVHAAIGGTGSNLGVFRLGHDVLRYKPDLLFVEFAVNDGGASPARIHKGMEGIVRQTWAADPTTDICYVYTIHKGMLQDLQAGKLPRSASAMEAVADHYGIPSVEMGLEAARMEKAGKLVFTVPRGEKQKVLDSGKIPFAPDTCHAYPDTGHKLYLEAVARAVQQMKGVGRPGAHKLPAPLVADNWEQAKLVPLDRAKLSAGWARLDPAKNSLAKRFGKRLPELWKVSKPGETITFRFKGSHVGFYDLVGPDCGQLIVTVDGGKPSIRRRVDGYCTYHRLSMLTAASGLPNAVHTVKVEVHPEQPDKAKILHKHRLPDMKKNPKKYDGTAWYVGAIMLIGDLVE